jgi:phosphopantothenoylcysteine decarboxylase/phosphopantothenate--cysteine ligase
MAELSGKRILLVIGGGVAAYKTLDLIRRLRERGAAVRAVMTPAAGQFVTPLSVASLSGTKVHQDLFSLTDEAEMGHIELSRAADLVVVAPATADLLARLANGLANDLASTLLLATDKKTLVAPAMNLRMWLHPATQRNVARLKSDGVLFTGPDAGEMACGEYGPGRMSEPLAIVAAIEAALKGETALPLPVGVDPGKPGALAGRRVVVTSGPTHEPIDPVRYIANRSSGKTGPRHRARRRRGGRGCRARRRSRDSARSARRDDPSCRNSARDAGRGRGGAAGRHLHRRRRRRRLARRGRGEPKDQERRKGPARPRFGREPGHPGGGLEDEEGPAAARRRFSPRRPRRSIEHARAKLARKGCDLIVANDVSPALGRHGRRERKHGASRSAPDGVESWPETGQGGGGAAARGATWRRCAATGEGRRP